MYLSFFFVLLIMQALVLLGNREDEAIVAIDSSDAKETKASDPEQALATIQAVLGL